jgi:hypothetical protein
MTLPNAKTPKQEPRPLSLVEEKLQQAQHDLDHWSKVAALPELSTNAAEWARNAARSAGAEVKLRERALAWAKLSQQQKLDQSKADHQTTRPQQRALPLEERLYRAGQHVVRA